MQSVGTLILFYCTFSSVGLYEAFASRPVPSIVMRASVVLLLASPVVNGFMFGLKNKVSGQGISTIHCLLGYFIYLDTLTVLKEGVGSYHTVQGCCGASHLTSVAGWADLDQARALVSSQYTYSVLSYLTKLLSQG